MSAPLGRLTLGRHFRRLALAAGVVGAMTGASGVQAADRVDVDALIALSKRSTQLTIDINESVQGALPQMLATRDTQTVDCLDTLRDDAFQVSDALGDVNDLAIVVSMMRDPQDEKAASAIRDISAKTALNVLAVERREINQTAGMCPTAALVQYKARDLILLIDDASAQLSAFPAKHG